MEKGDKNSSVLKVVEAIVVLNRGKSTELKQVVATKKDKRRLLKAMRGNGVKKG